MKKVSMLLLFLLVSATSAFAASETIEELIAELESQDKGATVQEQSQEIDGKKFSEELETGNADSSVSFTGRVTIKKAQRCC